MTPLETIIYIILLLWGGYATRMIQELSKEDEK